MDKTIKDLCSEWGKPTGDTTPTRGAIFIPDWRPTPLNKLRGHWSNTHRLKKSDREMIAIMCRSVPKATKKRKISLYIDLDKHQKRFDVDAPWKSLLDALVACGMLVDDSVRWAETGGIEFGRNYETPGTWILWQDLQ